MTRAILILLIGMTIVLPTRPAWGAGDARDSRSWGLCAREAARAERAHGIPRNLLAAIALAESGRWDDLTRENIAWPWTVMAEGRGRYLESKAAAMAEVRALRRRGVTNIDVGCMQINLFHHPDAFPDLDAAFDPAANAGYAARFLGQLREQAGSWSRAASHYHSRTPERARAYGQKVAGIWKTLNAGPAAPVATPVATPGVEPIAVADAAPDEASGVEAVADDAAAAVAAPRFAVAAPRRPPIDVARSHQLNARMKAARAASRSEEDALAQQREVIAWDDPRLDSLGATGNTPLVDARPVSAVAQRRQQAEAAAETDVFAERRRAQLSAWRRDPGVWHRQSAPAARAPLR